MLKQTNKQTKWSEFLFMLQIHISQNKFLGEGIWLVYLSYPSTLEPVPPICIWRLQLRCRMRGGPQRKHWCYWRNGCWIDKNQQISSIWETQIRKKYRKIAPTNQLIAPFAHEDSLIYSIILYADPMCF